MAFRRARRICNMSPAAFPPAPPFPFPAGADPTSFLVEPVNALIRQAGYLTIFTVPNSSRPNRPIYDSRGRMVGVEVHESLHRFAIEPLDPRVHGMAAANRVGEEVATVQIRWLTCPENFEAAPGLTPPPTPVDPARSQRFVMLDGHLQFKDAKGTGFRAFGAGRTMPMMTPAGPQLGLGSVIDIIEGFGNFKGLRGVNVVNGYINPPNQLTLSFLLRVMDPDGKLGGPADPAPLQEIPPPAPGTTILSLLGETDPDEQVSLRFAPDGTILGSNVVERLRLVRVSWDASGKQGVRTHLRQGPVVGRLRGTLHFNPLDPRTVFPIHTTNGRLEFFDLCGRELGMIEADINEGRAFRTSLGGAPMPVFRFGGFGGLGKGCGQFEGATGMMSLNAVISVFPRTLTNMYQLRINDPDGRFRSRVGEAWV